ncbi:MAG: TetR/AcrR family transcriptional regulator [Sphingomonadales bacterium]|nr:MAG: TetR/AcrR family transcriptional regulator [Sphingomonadales bacterium]
MPRLTDATAAKRRAHIIGAAIACFFERGFATTSVDDVCTQAAVSKGAFYSHFPSKEALIHATADLLTTELGQVDSTSVDALADSIFFQRIAPALTEANSRFGLEMLAASISDAGLRDRVIANLERVRAAVERAIADLSAAGLTRPDCDPRQAASAIQCYLLGTLTSNAIWRPEAADEVRDALRALVRGMIAP